MLSGPLAEVLPTEREAVVDKLEPSREVAEGAVDQVEPVGKDWLWSAAVS